MIRLAAGRMFDGETMHAHATVTIVGGRIAEVAAGDAGEALPADWLLAPGFVDLQVNGAGGVLFNHRTDAQGLHAMGAALAPLGTTAWLPTLISDRDKIAPALAAVAEAMAADAPGVAGLHVEGPFLNPARRGIHPARAIATMTAADADLLAAPRSGALLLTLAPECVGPALLARLAGAGVQVFVGHSDASAEQATAALAAGAAGFTHLFNAMSQFGSRAPGCVGAALDHGAACAGIICDGLHVHPAAIRTAFRLLGPGRLFLVSDCMPTVAGGGDGFVWDNEAIRLAGGRLSRADGTLAGAHLTMAEAVANAVRLCGLPLGAALRMATATPARAAGLAEVGRIAPGMRADLVALDAELRVAAVWRAGERIV